MSISPDAQVHPTAIVEEGARIGAGTVVEAYAIIGPEVKLGENVQVDHHAVIKGDTTIGDGSRIFSFAVVGEIPQDLKFAGEKTRLTVGERTRIREHATIHLGTEGGGGLTSVGDDCLIMAGAHVAHDAHIGNRVVMANSSAVAGHCVVGDDVIMGGLSGVHQWVRIGRGAMVGGLGMVSNDVIPYGMVHTQRSGLAGLNIVGLKRRGVSRDEIRKLIAAFKELSDGDGAFQERAARIGEETDSDHVREIVDFIMGDSDRSFMTPE